MGDPSGNKGICLPLHLGTPLQGYVHQQLEATEVLGEVRGGGWRGVEEPRLGARAAPQGGCHLSLAQTVTGLHGLGDRHAGVRGVPGDGGVTDDSRPGQHRRLGSVARFEAWRATGPLVTWGRILLLHAVAHLARAARHGELVRVLAVFPQHFGEQPPSGVYEPVTDLGETAITQNEPLSLTLHYISSIYPKSSPN